MVYRILVFLLSVTVTATTFGQTPKYPTINLDSSTAIGDAISAFNSKAASLAIPKHFAVKEWEVIDAIKGQASDPSAPASSDAELKLAVKEILFTKQLPLGTCLKMTRDGIVTLDIPLNAKSPYVGYGFIIRHPGLKRNTDGNYRMNFDWKPIAPNTPYDWSGKEWTASSH